MNRFWDFKLTGAPPLLSLVVRAIEFALSAAVLVLLLESTFMTEQTFDHEKPDAYGRTISASLVIWGACENPCGPGKQKGFFGDFSYLLVPVASPLEESHCVFVLR